ncbi:hypothetical protein ACWYXN_24920 [Janthinobacterium aestuarii]
MYPDPKRVRNNRVMVRLDEYEYDVLAAIANYQGEELAPFLRQLALRQAAIVIADRHHDTMPSFGA